MKTFVQELKKRRVYRVALAYAVAGSAIVQVSGTVLPVFHAPDWMQQLFLVLIALGFPIALMLAWAFDVQGGVITRTRLRGRPPALPTHRVWIVGAIGLLIAGAGVGAYWSWHPWKTGTEVDLAGKPQVLEPSIPEKSIAVLPFENLSDEKQNAYFTDGVQDEILNDLAKVADLKVISRTSVMPYKSGAARNLREIAKALRVAHVVEGSVQRAGNHVRVSAQLIDARTDTHVWAERYDRELADVFALESELAEQIVAKLKAKLSPEEKVLIEEQPTRDLAAYELYVRALALIANTSFDSRANQNLLEAARLLDQAVMRDPTFSLAYAELAGVHDLIYFYGVDHTPGRLASADQAVQAVLRLQPDSPVAHLTFARHLYFGYRNYDSARAELSLALRVLPNEPSGLLLAGFIDRRQGRWDESMRELEHALELDPRNVFVLQQIAQSYLHLHRHAEMAAVLDRALALAPKDPGTRIFRALVDFRWRADTKPLHSTIQAILAEDPAAAAAVCDEWFDLALCERDPIAAEKAAANLVIHGYNDQNFHFPHAWCIGLIARLRGDAAAARSAFNRAHDEVGESIRQQPTYAEQLCVLGMIDAALGRKDEAVREGERAAELLPIPQDSINGALLLDYLSIIYAWTGEKEAALKQLGEASRLPGSFSYGHLRLHPYWDPLRADPRFEKIVASLASDSKQP